MSTIDEHAGQPPLLERETELAAIEGAIESASAGTGSLVLIEGPAGIGKTRLLAEARKLGDQRGFLVRAARGGELERGLPFAIARQLFEPMIERASEEDRSRLLTGSAELALIALGRTAPDAAPTGDPLAPIHGLYWLVANLTEERPLLLAIDDAHWSDGETLRYLDYLARRIVDTPALVIVCARSGEPDEPPELGPLRLEAELLHPDPLSRPAVAELIGAELGADPATGFADACAEASAGNPFLVAELVRALRIDSLEPSSDAAAVISELSPKSVARQVLTRLGRFGDEAIALAQSIAVLGGSPQLRHAALVACLAEDRATELCDRLREAEIIAPGLPLDFVHPLVRSAIYRDLSELERSATHRRAAEALHEAGAGARAVAPHLVAIAPNGDQWVAGLLGEAAYDAIQSGAPDSARSYLERALEEPPEDEIPVLYGFGRALMGTDPGRAGDVLIDVAERTSDERMRVRALRHACYASSVAGNWAEAAHRCEALLRSLPEGDREQRLVLEGQLFVLKTATGHDRADWERISTVAAGAECETDGERLVRQAMAIGRALEAAPVDEVLELASSLVPPVWYTRTLIQGVTCGALSWCGHWDEARRDIARWLDTARKVGVLATVTHAAATLAEIDRYAGRLANAEAEARTACEIAELMGTAGHAGYVAKAVLLSTLIARGDLDGAEQIEREVDLSREYQGQPFSLWHAPPELRGYLRLARGERAAGAADLLEFGEQAERLGCLNPAITPWRQDVAPALAALDRTAEAEQIIAVAEERARAFGAAHVIGTVLRARGLIEPKAKAIETVRESVRYLEEYGPPHELARSLLELGSALRRKGSRSDAREPLQRSLELAAKSGAGGTERRAREELAAIGSRPRSAYRTGVASLTASELRVARLAAEGFNNREIAERLFVTRRTVETHLTHVYAKLEISGRDELAAALDDDIT